MRFTTRPELLGTEGMVASTHWIASAVGMSVLERGGNAFDAAVATGFTLQVVEPHLNGPAGEAPIIGSLGSTGEPFVVTGQGPAPAAATIPYFEGLGLSLIPGTGLLAACVPGAFDAWMLLLASHGTWRLADVLAPALSYAERGYPVVPRLSGMVDAVQDAFRDHWPTSAEIYLADGVPQTGTLFRNPLMAATYRRIVSEAEAVTNDRDGQIQAARDAFYRGFVAEAIDRFCRETEVVDSTGQPHAGLLRAEDLAAYEARFESPSQVDYGDYTVCKTGPWGQGPVFLQQLTLLDGIDLTAMGHNSADYIHTVVEAAKLAFADREAWYGDPDHVDVPLVTLLSPAYADERRGLIAHEASTELRPGSPDGRDPRMAPPVAPDEAPAPGTGEPTVPGASPIRGPADGDTCHLDVVDRDGNMVSATPSGGWLQSSPAVPGLGFPLGTRAQMFWLTPGLPNSLAPGKRPRTTLTPSLALRDGKPYLAFGTPGGDQQDQWTLLFFLAHVHFGLNLQEAIDAPMFHTTHFPSSFYPRLPRSGGVHIERRVGDAVLDELSRRGHQLTVVGNWDLGRVSAAGRDLEGGLLKAAANPRGMQGYAVGR